MPVTPAEPIGMSMPPTTPGAWGVGGGGGGAGAGGVSEPFFVDRPKFDNGTVFGSLFTTGFGGSAVGSGIASFFGAGGGLGGGPSARGAAGVGLTARGATAAAGATNLIFSVETSCGAAACIAP